MKHLCKLDKFPKVIEDMPLQLMMFLALHTLDYEYLKCHTSKVDVIISFVISTSSSLSDKRISTKFTLNSLEVLALASRRSLIMSLRLLWSFKETSFTRHLQPFKSNKTKCTFSKEIKGKIKTIDRRTSLKLNKASKW